MFKVGDILFGNCGYSMDLPTWYRVEKVTKTQVVVKELSSKVVSSDLYGQFGSKMPSNCTVPSKSYRCKVKSFYNGQDYITIRDNIFRLWDGSEKFFNYMD